MIDERRITPHAFVKGMDNISDETALPRGPEGQYLSARDAVNVDVSRAGTVKRREGYGDSLALVAAHSLGTDGVRLFGVAAGALLEFDPEVTPPTTLSTLGPVEPNARMDYAEAGGVVFCTNGAATYRILGDSTLAPVWAPTPDYLPSAVVTTGGFLPPGHYHFAFTWVEIATGVESGSTEPLTVIVAQTPGDVTAPTSNASVPTAAIVLTGLPLRAGYRLNIYANAPGGEELHRQTTIGDGATTYTATKTGTQGKRLEHLLLADQMPPGQTVETFKGRLFVAQGNVVWYSFPGLYGLTRASENYMQFNGRVTLVAATLDGVFVSADKTYFISGLESERPVIQTVHKSKAVEGSRTKVPAHLVGQNDDAAPPGGELPYWFSDKGPMIGLPGGKVLPLTEDAVAHKVYGRGASLMRTIDGIASVVTAVTDAGQGSRMTMGDSVAVEVIRSN
jgi:hypothetical protein